MAEVLTAIQVNPDAKGLAVIITNDYNPRLEDKPTVTKHSSLKGTFEDGKRLQEAFEKLDFDVHWKTNITSAEFMRIMYDLSKLEHDSVKDYRCMAFVFSGHGLPGKLIMQDGNQVDISDQFVGSVLPGRAPMIGDIPKIFIIDACRGEQRTETVPVPVTAKGSAPSETQTKGAHNMIMRDLPKEGNFLLTFSTLPGCESSDYKGKVKGSPWLKILASKIPVVPGSIDDVLSDVTEEFLENCQDKQYRIQQPDRWNRLHRRLYLLGDPKKNPADVHTLEVQVPPDPPERHQPLNPPTSTIVRNQQLTSQRASQVVPSDQSQSSPATQPAVPIQPTVPTQSAIKSKGNGGDYCNRLKDFTRPQFSYISQQVTPTTKRHRCTIKYVSNGQKKVEESDYYPSKKQAAERAAKKIFKQEQWPFERV